MVRKKFSRTQLLRFTANTQVALIGMEACAGSRFLGKALRGQGHEVRLMPGADVRKWRDANVIDDTDSISVVGRPPFTSPFRHISEEDVCLARMHSTSAEIDAFNPPLARILIVEKPNRISPAAHLADSDRRNLLHSVRSPEDLSEHRPKRDRENTPRKRMS